MSIASDIRIFIVEDDQVQAEVLKDKMKEFNSNYALSWFKKGEDLIDFLNRGLPKTKHFYLILDYYLQTKENKDALNGLEVINILKEKFPQINIVLFSAYESDNETSFDKIKEEKNVIEFVKKSDHAFSHVENVIRFHYTKKRLDAKKKRFKIARYVFLAVFLVTLLHLTFSYFTI